MLSHDSHTKSKSILLYFLLHIKSLNKLGNNWDCSLLDLVGTYNVEVTGRSFKSAIGLELSRCVDGTLSNVRNWLIQWTSLLW